MNYEMDFNTFRTFIKSIDVPAQRMGIFDLKITYRKENYYFYSLKENFSGNDDLMGFGLNHHYENCRDLPTKESIFHDSEDISIDIWRDQIKSINKASNGEITIVTKKWTGILTINN